MVYEGRCCVDGEGGVTLNAGEELGHPFCGLPLGDAVVAADDVVEELAAGDELEDLQPQIGHSI